MIRWNRSVLQLCIFSFVAAYVWFACNFDFSSFCGWTRESGTGAEWLIRTTGAPAVHRGPTHDHAGRGHVFLCETWLSMLLL